MRGGGTKAAMRSIRLSGRIGVVPDRYCPNTSCPGADCDQVVKLIALRGHAVGITIAQSAMRRMKLAGGLMTRTSGGKSADQTYA